MINLGLSLINPLSDRFNNIYNCHGTISRNKSWEFEILETNTVFMIKFSFNTRTDHAGSCVGLGIFGHEFQLQIYDNRHWSAADHDYK